MAAICTRVTDSQFWRCNEVNEALEEMYTHLEKLEESNKLLISFA